MIEPKRKRERLILLDINRKAELNERSPPLYLRSKNSLLVLSGFKFRLRGVEGAWLVSKHAVWGAKAFGQSCQAGVCSSRALLCSWYPYSTFSLLPHFLEVWNPICSLQKYKADGLMCKLSKVSLSLHPHLLTKTEKEREMNLLPPISKVKMTF